MSTSERDAIAEAASRMGVEPELAGAFGAVAQSLAGVPEAGVIARLANEMFKALPGVEAVAPAIGGAPGLSPAVAGLPASSAGALSGMPDTAAIAGLPGAVDLGDLTRIAGGAGFDPGSALATPSFYFLADLPRAAAAAAAAGAGAATALSSPVAGAGQALLSGSPPGEIRPEVVPFAGAAGRAFDAKALRRDFPILGERVHGKPLIWLDNAATTQKPRAVIERISRFYEHENSNIHRAAHALAARSTDAYEAARESVRRFLHAPSAEDIVFVRGATEGINFIAQSWGRRFVGEGDEIVVTHLEHHSNIVPWQLLCAEKGARLKVAPVDDSGQILLDAYEGLFGPRTRLVAMTHVSNALGTVTPVREMVEIAHRHGARVVVDGAQAVSHMAVDVQALGCDFYVFSGHKVFGPTGIGAVYGKEEVLAETPPWQGGGNMIADVTFERTVYHAPPMRFEAGTGNIADAVGLGAALDYVMSAGMENIHRHEADLLAYATRQMLDVPGLRLVGTARDKAGVLSFVLDGLRPEEVGKALDAEGIAVRAGHHCAQPILRRFGLESSVRPSLALYNTCEDIDALVSVLRGLRAGGGSRGAPPFGALLSTPRIDMP